MTAVHTKAIGERNVNARPTRRAAETKPRAQKILAAVDGSERTGRILEYLIGLAESGIPIEVVVLNIQPEPEDWRLRGYGSFKQGEIHDRLVNELGKPIVSSVGPQARSGRHHTQGAHRTGRARRDHSPVRQRGTLRSDCCQ